MHLLLLLAGAAFAAQPPDETEPTFTFVQSQLTGRHIAVQPKGDYYRVYILVRVRNCQNREVYGRVRCQPEWENAAGRPQSTLVTTTFRVETDNELWALYFRVPRFSQANATYQIELGEIEPLQLNDHVVRTTFAWQVRRNGQGEATFVHDLGNNMAVTITLPIRVVSVEGGEVRIRYAYQAPRATPVPLQYGFTNQGAQLSIDGDSTARKVNN